MCSRWLFGVKSKVFSVSQHLYVDCLYIYVFIFVSSFELSGLDLPDVTMGNIASAAKGLSRKRPRQSLNVTAFEKRIKGENGKVKLYLFIFLWKIVNIFTCDPVLIRTLELTELLYLCVLGIFMLTAAEEEPENSIGDHSSLSLSR